MNTCARTILFSIATLVLPAGSAPPGVPQLINYQGRVTVSGTNFDGTGQFKFSLVDSAGTTTFWSNDGTAVGGGIPSAAVSLFVHKGLYSVLLGDATLSNMTAVSSSVFTNAEVRLRVWFDDGAHGWQRLDPDQRIAAVGYAMMSDSVPDAAITSSKIAAGAVGSAHLVTGAVTGELLAPGAAASNLHACGQSGVPAGGTVLAAASSDTNLLNAGYAKLGRVLLEGGGWKQLAGAPVEARHLHTAIWTGEEMIVWGGRKNSLLELLATGGRYHPATDVWAPLSTNGAPSPRYGHTAVWTGSKMLVWGGGGAGGSIRGDGGIYDPDGDSWEEVATNSAPSGRTLHTAVWTGSRMLVWGGYDGTVFLNGGGIYDPLEDSWTSISTNGAPSPRIWHTAVWTGSKMLVWGGYDGTDVGGGGVYDPIANSWEEVSTNNAPTPRYGHSAVWAGSKAMIWGGGGGSGGVRGDGGIYDPDANTWTSIPTNGAPGGRTEHTAVWTGNEMIVWGGITGITTLADGGLYSYGGDHWTAVSTNGAPAARRYHTAVWSGEEMIVWGGEYFSSTDDPFSYTPDRIMYLYQRP